MESRYSISSSVDAKDTRDAGVGCFIAEEVTPSTPSCVGANVEIPASTANSGLASPSRFISDNEEDSDVKRSRFTSCHSDTPLSPDSGFIASVAGSYLSPARSTGTSRWVNDQPFEGATSMGSSSVNNNLYLNDDENVSKMIDSILQPSSDSELPTDVDELVTDLSVFGIPSRNSKDLNSDPFMGASGSSWSRCDACRSLLQYLHAFGDWLIYKWQWIWHLSFDTVQCTSLVLNYVSLLWYHGYFQVAFQPSNLGKLDNTFCSSTCDLCSQFWLHGVIAFLVCTKSSFVHNKVQNIKSYMAWLPDLKE